MADAQDENSGGTESNKPWWRQWSWWRRISWIVPAALTLAVTTGLVLTLTRGLENDFFRFLDLSLNELGDFFAGFAGTLALIWLVYGYFLQSRELRLQREELKRQREETACLNF